MPFIPERSAIPGALAQHTQWVCWRYESREGEDKPTKMPYQAKHPTWRASSTKPAVERYRYRTHECRATRV